MSAGEDPSRRELGEPSRHAAGPIKDSDADVVGVFSVCDDSNVHVTVLIVDDHQGFRASARSLLELDGFDVVGEAADGASAVEFAAARAVWRREHGFDRVPDGRSVAAS